MRAIGIIPARMASTRFPGKPLAKILGRAMIEWVWMAAKESRLIDPVFVATPDQDLAAFCEAKRIQVILTGAGCRNGTERCHDAMRQLAARDPDEIVVNIQGDEPAIRPESLDDLARAFEDPKVEIASLYRLEAGRQGNGDPNRVKVLVMKNGDAFSFTRDPVHPAVHFGIHIGVYGYRRQALAELVKLEPRGSLEQTAWLVGRRRIRMVPIDYPTAAVDTQGDLARAEEALEAGMRP
jgi:3-deoxy-manno-octulosonate cytidylyltransferase (CMP-KDO synthetase)